MKIYISSVFFILIIGCAKPFQPPPAEFSQWIKPGTSIESVKKKMLLCGFDNVYGNAKMSDNAYAKAQNCMLEDGFSHSSGFDICKGNINLSACK